MTHEKTPVSKTMAAVNFGPLVALVAFAAGRFMAAQFQRLALRKAAAAMDEAMPQLTALGQHKFCCFMALPGLENGGLMGFNGI